MKNPTYLKHIHFKIGFEITIWGRLMPENVDN